MGKGSSAIGTFLVSTITALTNNNHLGVIVLPVMLVIGLVLFILTDRSYNKTLVKKEEEGVTK